ncbi:hypothetical protein [Kitasatospora sp. NPDC015120]|uniref:hypothetical protein n=1 Tax=Kitasatospora sp. NPDC015120 TaxID=3364023 RepID=UPI0036F47F03
MTTPRPDRLTDPSLAERLAHVRWIAGGTAAGKSTLTRLLAERHGATVLDGDRAEHRWLDRCSAEHHPHLAGAEDKLAQIDRRRHQRTVVGLGIPTTRRRDH